VNIRGLITALLLLSGAGCAFDAAPPLTQQDAGPIQDAALDAPEDPIDTFFVDTPQPDPQPSPEPEPEPVPVPDVPKDDPELEICENLCEYIFDCLADICVLEQALGQTEDELVDGCINQCVDDPGLIQRAEQTINSACEEVNDGLCRRNPELYDSCECLSLSEEDTNVGAACTNANECEGGSRGGLCVLGIDEMGQPTGFPEGYCTVLGCQSNLDCGADNWCVSVNQGSDRACFDACRPSFGADQCRVGYGCWSLNGTSDGGICLQSCADGPACSPGLVCVDGGCQSPMP
jgi:hypothetical protein